MLRMRSGVSKDRPVIERKTRFDGSVQEFACRALLIEPGKRAVIRYEPVDQPYGYREYSALDHEGGLWSFMKPLD